MMLQAIEQKREDAKITQRDLCTAASIHPTTYSAIKNGRSGGHARTIQKLADALDALIEDRKEAS